MVGAEIPEGEIVVQPPPEDGINVDGTVLKPDSGLAALRAGCAFHGLSSSGSKGDVFREWLIIRRSWNWASKADGEEPGEDTGYSGAHHGLQPNLIVACGALRGKGQLDLMNRKTWPFRSCLQM